MKVKNKVREERGVYVGDTGEGRRRKGKGQGRGVKMKRTRNLP